MRVSVAVVTCNRPASLSRALESVRSQQLQPFEVVVSDDSVPEIAEENRQIAHRFAVRYLHGPRRGLYANRNAVAVACEGTHIRTMDDDHVWPAEHLSLCIDEVARFPRSVLTSGERSYRNGRIHDENATATQLHPSGVGGAIADISDNWGIADGATIYPRDIFDHGLRMMELRSCYGSSYLEFGALVYRHGFRSRCIPGAIVEHHEEAYGEPRGDIESRLFASLAYNVWFRPNAVLAARYFVSYLVRAPQLIAALPFVMRALRSRWGKDTRAAVDAHA